MSSLATMPNITSFSDCLMINANCLDALEQTAIDGGSWEVSWWLTTLPELSAHRKWAGSERMMRVVAEYREAIRKTKLQSSSRTAATGSGDGAPIEKSARAKKLLGM